MQWQKPNHIYNFGRKDFQSGKFFVTTKPHANLLYHAQGLQEDLTNALRSITAPVAFFAAGDEFDPVLFGKGIDHIRINKPDAKIVVFEDASHSIHWDEPIKYVDELMKVVSKNPGVLHVTGLSCGNLF